MKVFSALIMSIIMSVLLLCGCNNNEKYYKEIFALDTIITVTCYGDSDSADNIESIIRDYEKLFSATDKNSEIYKLNTEHKLNLSYSTAELVRKAYDMSVLTDGYFDITVFPAVDAWGFLTDKFTIPDDDTLQELKKVVGYKKMSLNDSNLTLMQGAGIDLGGCAKGYIGDKLAEFLSKQDMSGAVISLGGNIRTCGQKPDGENWQIGIEYPNSGDCYGTISVGETNIISSGAYQRSFVGSDGKEYHHILNPFTLYPAESDIKEATVICSDGTKADCLSTALYIMGIDKALDFCREHTDFSVVLLSNDDKIYITSDIVDSFELTEKYKHLDITEIR